MDTHQLRLRETAAYRLPYRRDRGRLQVLPQFRRLGDPSRGVRAPLPPCLGRRPPVAVVGGRGPHPRRVPRRVAEPRPQTPPQPRRDRPDCLASPRRRPAREPPPAPAARQREAIFSHRGGQARVDELFRRVQRPDRPAHRGRHARAAEGRAEAGPRRPHALCAPKERSSSATKVTILESRRSLGLPAAQKGEWMTVRLTDAEDCDAGAARSPCVSDRTGRRPEDRARTGTRARRAGRGGRGRQRLLTGPVPAGGAVGSSTPAPSWPTQGIRGTAHGLRRSATQQ